jgi:hypothetical protein
LFLKAYRYVPRLSGPRDPGITFSVRRVPPKSASISEWKPTTSAARIAARRRTEGISRPAVRCLIQVYRETRVNPSAQRVRWAQKRITVLAAAANYILPPPLPSPPPCSGRFPLDSGG